MLITVYGNNREKRKTFIKEYFSNNNIEAVYNHELASIERDVLESLTQEVNLFGQTESVLINALDMTSDEWELLKKYLKMKLFF